jgi:hypothetical protein
MTSMSHGVLTDPGYDVPEVPAASSGVGWLRASVARFSRGTTHERRRALAVAELAAIDLETLCQRAAESTGGPVEVLAEALGLSADVAADVAIVAPCYQPHTEATEAADQAVRRLIDACGGVADEATANRIGLLVQAYEPVKALVANLVTGRTDPPVPATRRVAPDGTVVRVDLTASPFGLGEHACPGQVHALTLAAGLAAREQAERP